MAIELNNDVFSVTVTELKPNEAVSIVNIDLTIDIEWEEPEPPKAPVGNPLEPDFDWEVGSLRFSRNARQPQIPQDPVQPPLFPGQGQRLDGVFDDTQPSTDKLCTYANHTRRHPKSNDPPLFPGQCQSLLGASEEDTEDGCSYLGISSTDSCDELSE